MVRLPAAAAEPPIASSKTLPAASPPMTTGSSTPVTVMWTVAEAVRPFESMTW